MDSQMQCITPDKIKTENLLPEESKERCNSTNLMDNQMQWITPEIIKTEVTENSTNEMDSQIQCFTPDMIKTEDNSKERCNSPNKIDNGMIWITPDMIRTESTENLLPEKSKERYNATYQKFMEWQQKKNTSSFSESVLLSYFSDLALTYQPSSLWPLYSMLRATLNMNNNVDITNYSTLLEFLKKSNIGFKGKTSKVLTAEQVEKFLDEAPDHQYLATKVGLIFGINGACRREEIQNILMKNINDFENSHILVKLPHRKTHIARSFIITDKFYHIVKKYMALRPKNCNNDRFFLKYRDGKCRKQPIGINEFGMMPKTIAIYLNLPDPEQYTGRSFRKTSATLLADAGVNVNTLKKHSTLKNSQVAENIMLNKNVVERHIKDALSKDNVGDNLTEDCIVNKKEIVLQIGKNEIKIINDEKNTGTSAAKMNVVSQSEIRISEGNKVEDCKEDSIIMNKKNIIIQIGENPKINIDEEQNSDPSMVKTDEDEKEVNITNLKFPAKNLNLTFNNCSNIAIHFH